MQANPGKEHVPQDGLLLTGHFDSNQIWYDLSSMTISNELYVKKTMMSMAMNFVTFK